MEFDRQNFSAFENLLPFYPPNNPKNQNFAKMKKNNGRYDHFTHVYHKQQSCDEWFLRYEARRTEVLVILDGFLLF